VQDPASAAASTDCRRARRSSTLIRPTTIRALDDKVREIVDEWYEMSGLALDR
jgi:hypothetical protein